MLSEPTAETKISWGRLFPKMHAPSAEGGQMASASAGADRLRATASPLAADRSLEFRLIYLSCVAEAAKCGFIFLAPQHGFRRTRLDGKREHGERGKNRRQFWLEYRGASQ